MERVGLLISKLQEQLQQNDTQSMLVTAQMLQKELLLIASEKNGNYLNDGSGTSKAAVFFPHQLQLNELPSENYKPVVKPEPEPAPIAEPEPEIKLPEETPAPTPKPEPEPVPHFVEQKPWEAIVPSRQTVNSTWNLDPVFDIPTLAHQENATHELNETLADNKQAALNDVLKEEHKEMAAALQDTPIHDLKKAISINDRHIFITELFRGDETMYERSIKTINSFNIYPEAEYWIQRELKVKMGWDLTLPVVKVFDQLVKRRFA